MTVAAELNGEWKQKAAEVAGAVETERNRIGWSSKNRKKQRWLEQWKQKAGERWL